MAFIYPIDGQTCWPVGCGKGTIRLVQEHYYESDDVWVGQLRCDCCGQSYEVVSGILVDEWADDLEAALRGASAQGPEEEGMGDDDYPTEEALKRLEAWPFQDARGALDFMASEWHWPDFGVSRELRAEERTVVHAEPNDEFLRLATGGWSGNENLIGAFRQNYVAWSLTWRLNTQGGLWIFQYPPKVAQGPEEK